MWTRWVKLGVTLTLYALVAPWGFAAFAVMVALPTRAPERRRDRLQWAIRTGFRLLHRYARVFGLLDVKTPAPDSVLLPDRCVVIANHPTHMDISAILCWIPRCCTVVKPSIYRRWWLEPLLRGSGQVEGAGDHPLDGARLVERASARVREGQRLVVFPEGTRTEEGRDMPFHRLGFEIACREGVPVVPLLLRCAPPYLSKMRPLLRPPRETPVLSVDVLPMIDPEEVGRDSRRLRERARALYTGGATRAQRAGPETSRTS